MRDSPALARETALHRGSRRARPKSARDVRLFRDRPTCDSPRQRASSISERKRTSPSASRSASVSTSTVAMLSLYPRTHDRRRSASARRCPGGRCGDCLLEQLLGSRRRSRFEVNLCGADDTPPPILSAIGWSQATGLFEELGCRVGGTSRERQGRRLSRASATATSGRSFARARWRARASGSRTTLARRLCTRRRSGAERAERRTDASSGWANAMRVTSSSTTCASIAGRSWLRRPCRVRPRAEAPRAAPARLRGRAVRGFPRAARRGSSTSPRNDRAQEARFPTRRWGPPSESAGELERVERIAA